MGSKVTHRITEDSTVCAAVFFIVVTFIWMQMPTIILFYILYLYIFYILF